MTTHMIGAREDWPAPAALGAADWVCLAAAPTFAIMALITGVLGHGPHDLFCGAMQDASPLSGMVWMYMLMSGFHSAPWLKLVAGWRARRSWYANAFGSRHTCHSHHAARELNFSHARNMTDTKRRSNGR